MYVYTEEKGDVREKSAERLTDFPGCNLDEQVSHESNTSAHRKVLVNVILGDDGDGSDVIHVSRKVGKRGLKRKFSAAEHQSTLWPHLSCVPNLLFRGCSSSTDSISLPSHDVRMSPLKPNKTAFSVQASNRFLTNGSLCVCCKTPKNLVENM